MKQHLTTWVLLLLYIAALCFESDAIAQDEIRDTSPVEDECPTSPYPACYLQDGSHGSCKPLASCAFYYATKLRFQNCTYPPAPCKFGCNSTGVCCPNVVYEGRRPEPVDESQGDVPPGPDPATIPSALVLECIEQAKQDLEAFQDDSEWERDIDHVSYFGNGVYPEDYTTNHRDLFDCGYFTMRVAACLQDRTNGTYVPLAVDQAILLSDKAYISRLPKECAICSTFDRECSEEDAKSVIRSYDGSCNNIENPTFGQSYTGTKKFFPPDYEDNAWQMKQVYDSDDTSRKLRTCLLPEKHVGDCGVSQFYTDFGQFVVHDAGGGNYYQGSKSGRFLDCCYNYDKLGMTKKCAAIKTVGDQFYERAGIHCTSLARIGLTVHDKCAAAYGLQVNTVTHYLDASQIYGSSEDQARALRELKHGLLKTNGEGCDESLPLADEKTSCYKKAQGYCRQCGDGRCNEQPGLLMVTTLFARLHNYCAKQIRCVNPYFNDEEIYQLCRRIIIAIYQHITYHEYLPLLLGYNISTFYGVMPPTCGYSVDYDPHETAATRAEWASATQRFHSSINGKITLRDSCYKTQLVEKLDNSYYDPRILDGPNNMDMFLRGRFTTCQSKIDKYYDYQITSCALRNETSYGLDMSAINVRRHADYGTRNYLDYRRLAQLEPLLTWEDFKKVMHPSDVDCLKDAFYEREHVPLYIGGLLERPLCDGLTGLTFANINAQMYKYWRVADKKFYTMPDAGFNEEQLEEIRKSTMAYVMCEASCVKCVPTFPFLVPGHKNRLICCSNTEQIPRIDWTKWKVQPGGRSGASTDL